MPSSSDYQPISQIDRCFWDSPKLEIFEVQPLQASYWQKSLKIVHNTSVRELTYLSCGALILMAVVQLLLFVLIHHA